MQAVLCDEIGRSRVASVPKPSPADDEVLVKVQRVQLSVTDCKLYRGADVAHADAVRRRLDDGSARLFGHEFCGTVSAVGEQVEGFDIGDRVYAPGKVPCGECTYCDSGHSYHCPDKLGIGFELRGAVADYAALPQEPLCKLPKSVSDAAGAAMQPLASALLCVLDADISSGDIVAVIGTGVMGYQCGQLAYTQGAESVYAVDVRSKPLELAERQGMVPIDARKTNPEERILNDSDGVGADVVFEAVGGQQTDVTTGQDPLAQAHRLVRRGGTIVQVGHIEGDVTLTPRISRSKSLNWVNPTRGVVPLGPNADSGALAAELVADGRISLNECVTHELPGLESFEEAVDITLNKEDHGSLGPAQIIVDG